MEQIARAMLNVQKQMPVMTKDSRGHTNSYLSLDKILATMRPILATNGLTVIQLPAAPTHAGNIALQTMVLHESGESISQIGELPLTSGNRGMNPSQAGGSAYTYLRRYGWSALFGFVTDPDVDAIPPATEQGAQELNVQTQPGDTFRANVDKGPLPDDEQVIYETEQSQFFVAATALIDRYNNEFETAGSAKKLGYATIPKGAMKRVEMYREIRAYAAYRDGGMDGAAALDAVKNEQGEG